jgi:transcriptional regulator with XRE-family HTH domain
MSRACRIFFGSLWRLIKEKLLKLPRLRKVRELRGWSQGVLAEKADVSRDSISNYETGHREAYPSTAKKLADALDVTIADLMEDTAPKAVLTSPLLEWALVASDEDFDHRIRIATEAEVKELLPLNNIVPQKNGPERTRLLERVSKIVSRLQKLGSSFTVDDGWKSEQEARPGKEAG